MRRKHDARYRFRPLTIKTAHAEILHSDQISTPDHKFIILFPQRQSHSNHSGKDRVYLKAVLLVVVRGETPKRLDCTQEIKYKDYEDAVNHTCRELLRRLSNDLGSRLEEIVGW